MATKKVSAPEVSLADVLAAISGLASRVEAVEGAKAPAASKGTKAPAASKGTKAPAASKGVQSLAGLNIHLVGELRPSSTGKTMLGNVSGHLPNGTKVGGSLWFKP